MITAKAVLLLPGGPVLHPQHAAQTQHQQTAIVAEYWQPSSPVASQQNPA